MVGKKSKQGGWTFVELMFVFVLVAGALHWFGDYVASNSDSSNRQAAVGHIRQVADASSRLIKANMTAYLAAASPTLIVSAADIATQLPSGFNMTNNYGQTYSLRLTKVSTTRLEPLLVTIGGDTLPNGEARKVAQAMAGDGGGFIVSTAPTQVTGGYGNWSRPMSDFGGASPGAGHFAVALFYKELADANSDLLHRNFEANAELNTMNTPINMQARAVEKTSDALCVVADTSTWGRIAADTNGKPLYCWQGVWTSSGDTHWREPVATYATLPTVGNAVSDVRMVTNLSRAFTWTGASWAALAVDQNGNLIVPGTARIGDAQINSIQVENSPCPEIGRQARAGTGMLLSCQSGSTGALLWSPAGGGGKGLSGVLAPLKGMSISCSGVNSSAGYAMVDANANLFTRAHGFYEDTGWISGRYATTTQASTSGSEPAPYTYVETDSVGISVYYGVIAAEGGAGGGDRLTCTAVWPQN